jgi:hypothetical protein
MFEDPNKGKCPRHSRLLSHFFLAFMVMQLGTLQERLKRRGEERVRAFQEEDIQDNESSREDEKLARQVGLASSCVS